MKRYGEFRKKTLFYVLIGIVAIAVVLVGRLFWLMVIHKDEYEYRAQALHERERSIKAARGIIYDRNGVVIADNKPVCTISVIHNQIKDPERVIAELSKRLELDEATVRKRVEKYSSMERIKSNVAKETADEIRNLGLDGVMVDEDYKRYYPYGELASKVLGFTGGDNQGIIGLEVKYDTHLQGTNGTILTLTTAHGIEIDKAAENRIEPIPGNSLYTSLDVNIQMYAQQLAEKTMVAKAAKSVSIIVMNPQNGELYAMANVPEFDLNQPYVFTEEFSSLYQTENLSNEEKSQLLNTMWRNPCISNTYEPGSAFKIVTATAALECNEVSVSDHFFCPGYKLVADRRIHCHKVTGHGSESFLQGIMNSCNPVFMEIGARVGAERFYEYFDKLGLNEKTGVDLPGEANSIKHKLENVGEVELATMSFGQSFQITPLQLMVAASASINGGRRVTPHFGVYMETADGQNVTRFGYEEKDAGITAETSELMRYLLEQVVAEGTGNRAYLPGYRVGGKTATSEKLPRSENRYIASFLGFAPSDNPQVMALILIDEPQGIYYGGTIAAPVIAELFANILPYLKIEAQYTEKEIKEYEVGSFEVPDFTGLLLEEAKKAVKAYYFDEVQYLGEGETITEQFPKAGETVNRNSILILYSE